MLPIEIYFEIFRHIRNPHHSYYWRTETETLLKIVMSSRIVGSVARMFLYQTVNFTEAAFTEAAATSLRLFNRTVTSIPELGSLVQTIYLEVTATWQLDVITSTMRHLTKLRKLSYTDYDYLAPGPPEWTLICAPHLRELRTQCSYDPVTMPQFASRAKELRIFSNQVMDKWPPEMDFPFLTSLQLTYAPHTFADSQSLSNVRHLSLLLQGELTLHEPVRLPHIPQLANLHIVVTTSTNVRLSDVFPSFLSITENNNGIKFLWVDIKASIDNDTHPLALPGNWNQLRTLIWSVESGPGVLQSFSVNMPQLRKLIGSDGFQSWTEYNFLPGGKMELKHYPKNCCILRECWKWDSHTKLVVEFDSI